MNGGVGLYSVLNMTNDYPLWGGLEMRLRIWILQTILGLILMKTFTFLLETLR